MKKLIGVMLLLGWGSAFAVPVQWTFQDVVFDDGSTLTGGFIFDVDSDTVYIEPQHPNADYYAQAFYFDLLIVTSESIDPQSAFALSPPFFAKDYIGPYLGEIYGNDGPLPEPPANADPSSYQIGLDLYKEAPHASGIFNFWDHLSLSYAQSLTNAGGTIALSGYQERDVYDNNGLVVSTQRSIVSGTLVGTSVVPIPAAVWLFGSGLGLLGWMRRRGQS